MELEWWIFNSRKNTKCGEWGYATEGALFISTELSSNAVRRPVEATAERQSTHVNMRRIHPGKKEKKSSVSIQTVVVLFVLGSTL